MEDDRKMKRLGKIVKDREGNLILVNEENEGFRINEVVAVIWYESDGKTIEELVNEFASKDLEHRDLIRKDIVNIVKKLKEVRLIA